MKGGITADAAAQGETLIRTAIAAAANIVRLASFSEQGPQPKIVAPCDPYLSTAAIPSSVAEISDDYFPTSRLLFFAQFLESGISAQRVPNWIEPKKRWRNGHSPVRPFIGGPE